MSRRRNVSFARCERKVPAFANDTGASLMMRSMPLCLIESVCAEALGDSA